MTSCSNCVNYPPEQPSPDHVVLEEQIRQPLDQNLSTERSETVVLTVGNNVESRQCEGQRSSPVRDATGGSNCRVEPLEAQSPSHVTIDACSRSSFDSTHLTADGDSHPCHPSQAEPETAFLSAEEALSPGTEVERQEHTRDTPDESEKPYVLNKPPYLALPEPLQQQETAHACGGEKRFTVDCEESHANDFMD